jgi:Escherichia/Staphylococcus phage prohead protease
MNRVFVALEIKALDEDARILEGWATTIDEDRMGDIVVPRGAKFELPMPFLLDHDHRQVVGEVNRAEVTDKGIKFTAQIKKIAEPGEVKDLCDKAWQLVKNGLRRAVSIGFRPLEMEGLKTGGLKFTSWEWYELSAVGVPAQANAVITGTKSYSLADAFVTEAIDDPEIPSAPEPPAHEGKKAVVVRLGAAAKTEAPFHITKIHRERKP